MPSQMKRLPTFVLVAIALACAVQPARAQSIAGEWDLVLQSPLGGMTLALTLKQDGEKLTGELAGPMGAMPVSGTYANDKMAVAAKLALQGISLELALNGTLAGDAITGTAKAGNFGEFPFTAKRKAPPAVPAAPPPVTAPPVTAPSPSDSTAAGALNITGPWKVVLSLGPAGEFPLAAVLKQDGESLTGTINSPLGEVVLKGTMVANALTLSFKTDSPQGPIEILLTGELAGDEIKGKAAVAGLGEADWKATRGK